MTFDLIACLSALYVRNSLGFHHCRSYGPYAAINKMVTKVTQIMAGEMADGKGLHSFQYYFAIKTCSINHSANILFHFFNFSKIFLSNERHKQSSQPRIK